MSDDTPGPYEPKDINERNASFFWKCKACGLSNVYTDDTCYECGEVRS